MFLRDAIVVLGLGMAQRLSAVLISLCQYDSPVEVGPPCFQTLFTDEENQGQKVLVDGEGQEVRRWGVAGCKHRAGSPWLVGMASRPQLHPTPPFPPGSLSGLLAGLPEAG